jgi:hypothetical protein
VTIPAVPAPKDGSIRTPLDFRLKPGWHFDAERRTFRSAAGEAFSPRGKLPKASQIVYKTPNLARADESTLDTHERELRRHMQVILPHGVPPDRYLAAVRGWPPVEEAHLGPEVSLPGGAASLSS